MKENKSVRLLAYISGLVNHELLLQNEYLVVENRILSPICRLDCDCLIRSGPSWPKSATDSGASPWPKWPSSPSRTRYWAGIAAEAVLDRKSVVSGKSVDLG